MNIQDFFDLWNNKGCDFDGVYGFQCMDLANQYNKDVIGAPRLAGNAVDAWTTYSPDFYDKIENTPTNTPALGDIVIWGTNIGVYGHIAVCKEADTNNFTSFDQNWPLDSLCHFQNHNYNGVLGWLHPRPATPVQAVNSGSVDNSGMAGVDNYIQLNADPNQIKIGLYEYGWMERQAIRGKLIDLDKAYTEITSLEKELLNAQQSSKTVSIPSINTFTGSTATTTQSQGTEIPVSSFFSQLISFIKSLFGK